MRTLSFILVILFSSILSSNAQNLKPVAQLIEDEKLSGNPFEMAIDVFTANIFFNKSAVSSMLDAEDVTYLDYDFAKVPDRPSIKLQVPMGSEIFTLELVQSDPELFDYEVKTGTGESIITERNSLHYQGIVAGDPNSLVAISLYQDMVMGLIATDKGNFVIGKSNNATGLLMIYNDHDLKQIPEITCGFEDDDAPQEYDPEILLSTDQPSRNNSNCVNIHFTTEVDLFTELGSATAVDNYVRGFFHQVAILYFNDGVSTRISSLTIWTTTDPYTATNTGDLLTQYKYFTGSFSGDLSQLITFRDVGGGLSSLSGLCNFFSHDAKKSVSGINNFFNNVPIYSRTVSLVAHELGHSMGARHTHACVWNGNNTAIDHCGSYWGFITGETNEGISCLDTINPRFPSQGGSVMSYCHLQSVGINLNEGFQAQVANVIRNKVDTSWCLNSCQLSCDNLCDIEADITSVFWGSGREQCQYKFIGSNLRNPMCMDDYTLEWRIQGVLPVVSTNEEFIYNFSNFTNGTYDVTLKISYDNGGQHCEDTFVQSITIGCGVNPNPTCPSASGLFLAEAEPCLDYIVSYPFNSSIASISWKYNIHGVNGEQNITTTTGSGPFAVPFSLPGGHDYDYHYLWVHGDVTLTNGVTCRISESKLLDCPNGGGQKVTLYPNPTKGSFSVQSITKLDISDIKIRGMYGNLVFSAKSNDGNQISLDNKPLGVYFVEITFVDGTSEVKKLILEQ